MVNKITKFLFICTCSKISYFNIIILKKKKKKNNNKKKKKKKI